jgi:hypothetical protein
MEAIVQGLVIQARRKLADRVRDGDASTTSQSDRLEAVERQLKTSHGIRYYRRGLIYISELDSLRLQVKSEEVKNIAERIEGKERTPALSLEELEALSKGKGFGAPGRKVIPPLDTRLFILPELTQLDSEGNLANIYRILGAGDIMIGMTYVRPFNITKDKNALVGAFGPPHVVDESNVVRRNVIPLNDEAIAIIGEYTDPIVHQFPYTIALSNLGHMKPDELPAASALKQK